MPKGFTVTPPPGKGPTQVTQPPRVVAPQPQVRPPPPRRTGQDMAAIGGIGRRSAGYGGGRQDREAVAGSGLGQLAGQGGRH